MSREAGGGGLVPKTRPLIAIVDDDEPMREAIGGLMQSLGYRAETYPSAAEFLNSGDFRRTACLIADVQMPGMTGLELHRHLMTSGNSIPTILVTAFPEDGMRRRALADGVVCCLSKPFDENDLLAAIRSSLSI
jgi:FixJ family two-component response regulator